MQIADVHGAGSRIELIKPVGLQLVTQNGLCFLQVADEHGAGSRIELVNPAGLQLVTQSHFRRAADRRFGEPEDLVEQSLEYCR